jgi:hypothetical protein
MSLAPVPVPKILDWVPLEWFDITPGVTLFGLAGRPASASVALFRCEIHVTLIGVHTVCRTYKELFEDTDRTYSNDGGKTWNQCGKIVEKDQ